MVVQCAFYTKGYFASCVNLFGLGSGNRDVRPTGLLTFFIESLTDELESKAWEYIKKIDSMGGAVPAIESGFIQNEIASASYAYQQSIQDGTRIIVGVNKFEMEEPPFDKHLVIDDSIREVQVQKLIRLRSERNSEKSKSCIAAIESAAKENRNLMPVIIDAVENLCTLGEIADAMRRVFGEYK